MGGEQTIALEHIRHDVAGTGAWALSLPEGSSPEAAVQGNATQWSRSSPQGVAAWASAMTEPILKQQALVSLGRA